MPYRRSPEREPPSSTQGDGDGEDVAIAVLWLAAGVTATWAGGERGGALGAVATLGLLMIAAGLRLLFGVARQRLPKRR